MKTSDSTKQLVAAMAKSALTLENPVSDGLGNFNNRFVKLATGLDTIRKVYGENNIVFTQMTRFDGEMIMLDTRISHSSGEWIEGEYPVCRFPVTSQQLGSAMSYARRYAIFSAAGIAPVDDPDEDDGTEANKVSTPAPKRQTKTETPEMLSIADSSREKDTLLKSLTICTSQKQLLDWAENTSGLRKRLHKEDGEALKDAYNEQKSAITEKAAA